MLCTPKDEGVEHQEARGLGCQVYLKGVAGGSEDLERPSSDKQRNVTHFWSVVRMEAISRLDAGIVINHDSDDSDSNHSSHLLRLDPGLRTSPVHAGGFQVPFQCQRGAGMTP